MNLRRSRIILILFLLVGIPSCAIGPQGSYYKPSSPDSSSSLEGAWAYGAAGPPAVIKIPAADGVVLRARLDDSTERMRIGLLIDVPHRSSAQFSTDEIQVTDPSSGKEWTIRGQDLDLLQFPSISIPANATIEFDKIGPTTSQQVPEDISWKDFQIWVQFNISDYHPRAVKIYLPFIIANDERYEIPAIELMEDEEVKEQNRLEAKGKQRLWWWPYKAKERKDGSWLNINGFTIGGGVTFGYLNNEFGGNIMVSFPPSSIWRFSSNVIRIVDVDTGKEYLVNFEKLLPQFHLKVSFTSPVLGRGSGLRTEASTDIVVSENPFESLVFQLPTLIVNDEEIAIKPIQFKKGFGFGLIPFNY